MPDPRPQSTQQPALSAVWPLLEQIARSNHVSSMGASHLDDDHAALFEEWLAAGREAGMSYLRKNAAIRSDPRGRFPWAKSVIVITVPYGESRDGEPSGSIARHLARFAQGDDYHDTLDMILRQLERAITTLSAQVETRRYVDTGPLSDRSYGAQAGLGWIGRNGMLIDPERGSYFLVGTLLTSLTNDLEAATVADRCGSCTRCIDACPTAAILPDRTIDSARCISYATIEHRGPIEEPVRSAIGENLFGCDICQEVCPWNHAPDESHPAFQTRQEYRATPVTDLLHATQQQFSALFRKSAVKRARLAGMVRNAEIVVEGK